MRRVIAMRGVTGPELQQDLERRRTQISIIFKTALVDGKVRIALLRRGAAHVSFSLSATRNCAKR
jgi:FixJ family two-component response regulator